MQQSQPRCFTMRSKTDKQGFIQICTIIRYIHNKTTDILLPLNEPIVPKSLNKGANITFEFEFITIMYFSTHFGTELNTLILKSKLCHT